MTTLGERVRAERVARGWSQAELARRVSLIARRKITQVAIHHIESRGNTTPRFLLELAEALGLWPDWLQTGRGVKTREELIKDFRGSDSQQAAEPAQTSMFAPLVAPRRSLAEAAAPPPIMPDKPDIPVWASVAAGDGDGSMILTSEPIDYIRRSERTLTVPNPWAFHVIGDSMLERLAQGDQVVINPAMPLLPMTDCVFVHQADDGAMYALVKRLLRANSDVWRVRQLNPAKDFELSRKKWSKAYRIAEIRPRM